MYKVYELLPIFMQNIVCTIYGLKEGALRFNKNFKSKLLEFVKSDYASSDEISTVKHKALSESLVKAKKSGFYKTLESISEEEIRRDPFLVLSNMPILTKDQLRDFKFTKPSLFRGVRCVVTSGTTGKALKLLKDKMAFSAQWAIWFRHRARFGVSLSEVSVNFSGKPLVPLSQKKPPYWRFNRAQNQYLISMQHINDNTIAEIVDFLNSIQPKFYSGYPSIIAEVARLAIQHKLYLSGNSTPSVVFTGAEKLLLDQQRSISDWLGSDVVLTDQYGLTEGNCNFSKCEKGNYHEDFEFCHIEIIDSEVLSDGSVMGRLVGTSFYNSVMPLIRYDTGDIAVLAPKNFSCTCGRSSRVIKEVDGRVDDYVILPNNKRVMRFDYLFKDTFEVVEAQVIQNKYGAVEILAVLAPGASSADFEKKVRAHFEEYIHKDLIVDFSYTERIERSGTGKFKAVLNRLET